MNRPQLHRLHKWIAVSADYPSASVSPAEAASAAGEPVSDIALIRVAGRLVSQVQTRKGSRLVDAPSGELFPMTLDLAERIVRSEYLRGSRGRFRRSGSSVRKVTPAGRVRAIIGSMHTFEVVPGIEGNRRIQKLALAGAATIGLGAVATGYWIALNRRRKVQAG